MVNKNYLKGANFERKIKDEYEKQGYLVIRSAGSHSIADLIAIPSKNTINWKPILIQCKVTSQKTSHRLLKEMLPLRKTSIEYGCRAILVIKLKKSIDYELIVA